MCFSLKKNLNAAADFIDISPTGKDHKDLKDYKRTIQSLNKVGLLQAELLYHLSPTYTQ